MDAERNTNSVLRDGNVNGTVYFLGNSFSDAHPSAVFIIHIRIKIKCVNNCNVAYLSFGIFSYTKYIEN